MAERLGASRMEKCSWRSSLGRLGLSRTYPSGQRRVVVDLISWFGRRRPVRRMGSTSWKLFTTWAGLGAGILFFSGAAAVIAYFLFFTPTPLSMEGWGGLVLLAAISTAISVFGGVTIGLVAVAVRRLRSTAAEHERGRRR
jgi:hypothetical protein